MIVPDRWDKTPYQLEAVCLPGTDIVDDIPVLHHLGYH